MGDNVSTGGWLLIVLILMLGAGAIWIYNRLVARRHHTRAAWSDIDVQLRRRHDLVPKLAAVVRAYADHESSVQTAVVALRTASGGAQRVDAENQLTATLGKLFAVAEAYPELKASEQFLSLQREISAVEEQIQYARRYFNGAVRELNILVESFPSNLVARLTGFTTLAYFRIELATQRESPTLGFDTN